ncbi:MAG: hypothetical protein EP298_09895 [Gammaproteobacteria bacterium]|nr:MAG: hypothetical protein EP298_09895 [Gammaproteobacteria bacterium]UTW41544.1 hypothetical protein KFE69_08480 [bacterium SCSIO 12844]
MKIITNTDDQCRGAPNCHRVVSNTKCNGNFTILHTDGISDCLGIGVLVYNESNKLDQISICHSISEHYSSNLGEIEKLLQNYKKIQF